MPQSTFTKARISGIVSYVPSGVRYFDKDSKILDSDPKQIERIKKTIGLNKRHVTSKKTTTLDLCHAASLDMIIGLKLDKKDIDALIFVTQTPDHFQPCNAAILHGKLGLKKDCASFDVNLGCSGYVYALWLSHMMVETGGCNKVLVLSGDTLSKCTNDKDRSVGFLFGDGGTASLVEKCQKINNTFFTLNTDGGGSDHIKIPAGGFRLPRSSETKKEITNNDGNTFSQDNLIMNGGEVFNFSISEEPESINNILSYSNSKIEDIDYIVFHQANKYIISNIARRLKISTEKTPMTTVEKYGNQSSASIPCTINDVLGEELVSESKNVILSGFGVGLSWASCMTKLKLDYCPKVKIYKDD